MNCRAILFILAQFPGGGDGSTRKGHVMKYLILILLVSLTSCSIMQPQEDETQAPEPHRMFVSVGGMYGIQQFDFNNAEKDLSLMTSSDVNLSADDSPGLDLRAGFRFDDHLAAVVQYMNFVGGDIDAKSSDPILADTKIASYSMWALFLDLRGYFLKPEDTFQPYASFGGGILGMEVDNDVGEYFDENTTDGAIKLGGGLDVRLTDHLFIYFDAAYIFPAGELARYDMVPLSLGLQVRF